MSSAILIALMVLLALQLDAQLTLDDNGGSCESSTSDQVVNLIRESWRDVKTACAPCASNQPCQPVAVDTPGIANCIPVLVQQNINGSKFFNRSWEEFKVGFNSTFGNYWIGNDLLSQLTLSGRYKLRFELQARDNSSWYWAEYSSFTVLGESSNYALHVSGYSGNAGYDALGYHNGMMFTTYDRDNDPWTSSSYNGNCAVYNGGGFWYKRCSHCDVNTVRGRGDDFKWYTTLLRTSRMWLTC